MGISTEARAIQALCNDIDTLQKQAAGLSDEMEQLQIEFLKKAKVCSDKQKVILQKIGASQEAIAQLQYKNTVKLPYTY